MIDIEKMNRKETILALRACEPGGTCYECPLYNPAFVPGYNCVDELLRHAADVLEASVSVQYE